MNFVKIAKLADLEVKPLLPILVNGTSVLLCRTDSGIYAIENECSHAFQSLECGVVRSGWIACPAHGARFDLETGQALGPPAKESIRTFAVKINGDSVLIDISGIA